MQCREALAAQPSGLDVLHLCDLRPPLLPPLRLEARPEFAIRAARPFDMPLRLRALYLRLFLTELPAIVLLLFLSWLYARPAPSSRRAVERCTGAASESASIWSLPGPSGESTQDRPDRATLPARDRKPSTAAPANQLR